MVSGEVLSNQDPGILHVANANRCGLRLGVDERPKVVKLNAKACVGSIIDQDEQVQPRGLRVLEPIR